MRFSTWPRAACHIFAFLAIITGPVFGQQTPADPAAVIFRQKCAGCHSIGKGQIIGPDLTIARTRTEPVIIANIKRMQQNAGPLTDGEIAELADLLQDPNASRRIAAQEQAETQTTRQQLAPPSAARGRELFEGRRRLQNGGLACMNCHRVNGQGGTVGLDLTDAATRLGTTALPTTIAAANFPVMKDAFKTHPITPREAADITAYLAELPAKPASSMDQLVPWLALAGALAMLGIIAVSYRNRNNGARARLQRR